MLVARQMAKLWDARKFDRILDELLGNRVETAAASELREHAEISPPPRWPSSVSMNSHQGTRCPSAPN